MEGFLPYRQRTEVDFTDADLFVLSGPTGAGKSSVIDGMVFALYGSIPRLDDKGSVAPVISARADRARVSFQFTVGDDTYVAARLVERKGSGASTTEASLETADGEVLARGPGEVTAGVTELLGLTYDQFTKAVVLPQGAFADFLTDKPSERQALLRALLEVGLFEQIMQMANARAKTAEVRAHAMEESLAKLEVPTPEQLAEARGRLEAIQEAKEQLPARIEGLNCLRAAFEEANKTRIDSGEALARLVSIETPDDLDALDKDRLEADTGLEEATAALRGLVDESKAAGEALAGHAPLGELEAWATGHARLEALAADRDALGLDSLTSDLAAVTADRNLKLDELTALRLEHASHTVRQGLVIGEPCPVCAALVKEIPATDGGPGESIDRLSQDVAGLDALVAEARDRLKVAEGGARQMDQQVSDLSALLAGAPGREEVDASIGSVREVLAAQADANQKMVRAQQDVEEAKARVDGLSQRGAGLLEALLTARDQVSSEKPPMPVADPVDSWRGFEVWRQARVEERKADVERLDQVVAGAEEEAARAELELMGWLEGLDVERSGSLEANLALAGERSRAEIEALEKSVVEAGELGGQIEVERAQARVAGSLGNHLKSSNFEAWLLEEAMETLVDGANVVLHELTGGAYSLVSTRSQFEVIDHRNADLTRTTKGLSGGETFLVALALALSMAEQLAQLTGTSSRLESVLLDEGFGSLDQESIDVVASVLDELAGSGRTVGLVTHVRELAERIPVRFEVTKGPESSSIEKVLL
jgi:exonuclease SbcC